MENLNCLIRYMGLSVLLLMSKFAYGYESKPSRNANYQLVVAIKPQFDTAGTFSSSGLAPVCCLKGKSGYINSSGQMVIKPIYEMADEFADNGLASIRLNGKYGYINTMGKIVIKAKYDLAYGFGKSNYAPICLGGFGSRKCGYISSEGSYLINPKYDEAGMFSEVGLAAIRVNDKWGYIDKNGSVVIKPKYFAAQMFSSNGLAAVAFYDNSSEKMIFGFINKTGDFKVRPRFDYDMTAYKDNPNSFVSTFSKNNLAAVLVGEKWGYIDSSGSIKIQPAFASAWMFSQDGLAVVVSNYQDRKLSIIDSGGRVVIKTDYMVDRETEYSFGNNGYVPFRVGDKWGYFKIVRKN